MTWSPDPAAFLRDLEAKPPTLRAFADVLAEDPWAGVLGDARRIVFVGMGSSRFAAAPIAARLRARGIDAVADHASTTLPGAGGPGTLAIGISASGSTPETVAALARYEAEGADTVAITGTEDGGSLGAVAGRHLPLHAGVEAGGVACRTFQHTVALLLALEDHRAAAAAARRAAEATEQLLASRGAWLPAAADLIGATDRAFLLAPAARSSSAEQGALMLREGPRLHADACESGDWLHVDVYLTKPLDYRAVVFTGSPFDDAVMGWMRERSGRVLAMGGSLAGATQEVRYDGDDDERVALLTEVLVPELIAAAIWRAGVASMP